MLWSQSLRPAERPAKNSSGRPSIACSRSSAATSSNSSGCALSMPSWGTQHLRRLSNRSRPSLGGRGGWGGCSTRPRSCGAAPRPLASATRCCSPRWAAVRWPKRLVWRRRPWGARTGPRVASAVSPCVQASGQRTDLELPRRRRGREGHPGRRLCAARPCLPASLRRDWEQPVQQTRSPALRAAHRRLQLARHLRRQFMIPVRGVTLRNCRACRTPPP